MNIKDMLKAAGFTETVNSEVLTTWTVDAEPVGVVELKYEVVDGEVMVIGELLDGAIVCEKVPLRSCYVELFGEIKVTNSEKQGARLFTCDGEVILTQLTNEMLTEIYSTLGEDLNASFKVCGTGAYDKDYKFKKVHVSKIQYRPKTNVLRALRDVMVFDGDGEQRLTEWLEIRGAINGDH